MMRVPPLAVGSLNQYPLLRRSPPALPRNSRLASPDFISAQGVTYSDRSPAPIISGIVTIQSMRSSFMPLTPDTRRMTSSLR
ncbi:hypothetical protein D9M68_412620 [compost metagenome]